MIFLLIIVCIGTIVLEVPEMIKNQYWRELKVFSVFLTTAFIISLLYSIGVTMPNPLTGWEYLIKNILHLNYR